MSMKKVGGLKGCRQTHERHLAHRSRHRNRRSSALETVALEFKLTSILGAFGVLRGHRFIGRAWYAQRKEYIEKDVSAVQGIPVDLHVVRVVTVLRRDLNTPIQRDAHFPIRNTATRLNSERLQTLFGELERQHILVEGWFTTNKVHSIRITVNSLKTTDTNCDNKVNPVNTIHKTYLNARFSLSVMSKNAFSTLILMTLPFASIVSR